MPRHCAKIRAHGFLCAGEKTPRRRRQIQGGPPGAQTKTAAVTKALKELVARCEQKRVLELFGALEWDQTWDVKADRSRC